MMAHKNNFCVAVKSGGKILRDVKEDGQNIVHLPFGSDYAIVLKNLDSRKAQVKITIDGTNVLDGHVLLINPNETFELEGFLDGMKATNSFRFIEKTKEVSDYRGDKIDDGIIRVEYTFEKKVESQTISGSHWYDNPYNNYYTRECTYKSPSTFDSLTTLCSSNANYISTSSAYCTTKGISEQSLGTLTSQSLDGITVKGQEVNQQFKYGTIGQLEENSSVITMVLKGTDDTKPVEQPITVDTKLTCPTCGKESKSDCKFCARCGSYLPRINKKV